MKVVKTKKEMKKISDDYRKEGKSIGFVPTMGYLHAGHLSLVRAAKKDNDVVVVSIFVNPLQFGPQEDLDRYPRDFERDCSLLEKEGVDILFYPDVQEMYPDRFLTKVSVKEITEILCGASRPGHFDGVCTVVTKLFNIVKPHRAYFGKKDYQQLKVIEKFVEDLDMDVEVIGMPIVRESDGLAMSSRNVYLSDDERKSALSLNKSFDVVKAALDEGVRDVSEIKRRVHEFISSHPYTKIDYIEIVDPETLEKLDVINKPFLLALAVFVGKARLIDNNIFEV
ncbi:pantoate--beta-alanine ligase [Deferribacter autotrophicus]|uniref:Pantothenate synthetase n=1 Tax=Deferribacter autotrophicus TaxID=500465 RepID=A0A5A8F625_9BACT|nr:pantoate--beta-alanine ligase [Deferribacter autotrophicus]KAA0259195.1 pantoate--beta-alanine ligase [Deferribacter autotrophicus]